VFEGQYVLWGGEHSLFTRKLQAMLNYLGVSYTFKLKSEASQAPTLYRDLKPQRAGSCTIRRQLA